MRRDMPKVIVDRARYGSSRRPRKRHLPKDPDKLDALPKRESSRRRVETYDYKCDVFRDRLEPLRRYLKTQVGRPWDKVWSEICAYLHPRSTMHQHVRDHVLRGGRAGNALRQETARFGCVAAISGGLSPVSGSIPRTGILRDNLYRIDSRGYLRNNRSRPSRKKKRKQRHSKGPR